MLCYNLELLERFQHSFRIYFWKLLASIWKYERRAATESFSLFACIYFCFFILLPQFVSIELASHATLCFLFYAISLVMAF